MLRTLLAGAVLVAALLTLPAQAQDAPKAKLPKWKKGTQTGTVLIDGKEESFTAAVPKGYSPKKKWPTVLLAHGNGGKAANFVKNVAPAAGKKPPLLISLERCDNNQDAIGYVPKYLAELTKQFAIDEELVFALGFSGGGFRLWDDVVCKADQLPKFRGVVLVGCAKQSFDPPEKPEKAPTVIFIGDPKDGNYGKTGKAAQEKLRELGYEVIVHEHKSGHSVPRKQLEAVFEWIAKTVKAAKKKK